MNDKYFGTRIENSTLGKAGIDLLNAQAKLISQGYEIEILRLKAARWKASVFQEWDLENKLRDQITENKDALVGDFDGFCYASWRTNAVFRTLEDMVFEGLITEKEYKECNFI